MRLTTKLGIGVLTLFGIASCFNLSHWVRMRDTVSYSWPPTATWTGGGEP